MQMLFAWFVSAYCFIFCNDDKKSRMARLVLVAMMLCCEGCE
jgi:hypothetical protein